MINQHEKITPEAYVKDFTSKKRL